LILALTGCASMRTSERLDALETSLSAYSAALRWGHYEDAASYRMPRSRTVQPLDQAQLEHIRVASFDVLEQIMDPEHTEATVTAAIQYYVDDAFTLKTLRDRQIWWYDEKQKRWFLDGDLPNFTGGPR
jgi:hypothetical protein